MRHPVRTVALALGIALVATGADEIDSKREKILYPAVRVKSSYAQGSGTVVYSEARGGEQRTFVLTNHHVVASAIKVVEEWDNLKQRKVQKEKNDLVDVEIFNWVDGVISDQRTVKAAVYAHDREGDLALLELKSSERPYPEKLAYVAKIAGPGRLRVFTPIVAVGCGMGLDPTHSSGEVTDPEEIIEGKTYTQGSAPIIFGNSGGAVYALQGDGGDWRLVGIPARIVVQGGAGVNHLNFFIPPPRIHEFVRAQKVDFLTDSGKTPADADKAREEAREPKEGKP